MNKNAKGNQTPFKTIEFYNGSRSFKEQWPELQIHLDKVMELGKFSHGKSIGFLEKAICDYTGARHAIAVNSATDALILLLRAAGIQPGDEVIVPCYTFFASASSIVHAGGVPVFADVEPGSLTIDPNSVRKAITEKTKAIMPVHFLTQMADMEAIQKIADEYKLLVIEDSAQAIGMKFNGVHAGLLGMGGVLSFFPTKTLGALGDAGMILTNNDELATQVSFTRHHGRTGETIGHMPGISHQAVFCGTNSKMDDIQAAVLLTRLKHLDNNISKRAELANYYDNQLKTLNEVQIPKFVRNGLITNPVYYVYSIQAQKRDLLVKYLNSRGIATEVYYPIPLHLQPCFKRFGYKTGDFPIAEAASKSSVALPFYPDLSFEEAVYVCSTIKEFYQENK